MNMTNIMILTLSDENRDLKNVIEDMDTEIEGEGKG